MRAGVVAAVLILAAGIPRAAAAQEPLPWDVQWNARFGQGFGKAMGDLQGEFLYELHLRGEALFGRPGDEHVRIGPHLEVREVDFDTFETAAGASVLLPVYRGFPIVLTAAAGYALRGDMGRDGGVFVGTLAWGYRSYNYHSRYQLGIQFFWSTRVHTDNPNAYEMTGGIELDLALLFGMPALMVRMYARGDDPDERREEP